MEEGKKQISIKNVLENLENGMTRIQIGEEYGISAREVKMLFEHEQLKGKQAKKKFVPSFEIVDDVSEVEATVEANTDDVKQQDIQFE